MQPKIVNVCSKIVRMRTQHFPTVARTANEASATGHSVDNWVVFSKRDSSFDAQWMNLFCSALESCFTFSNLITSMATFDLKSWRSRNETWSPDREWRARLYQTLNQGGNSATRRRSFFQPFTQELRKPFFKEPRWWPGVSERRVGTRSLGPPGLTPLSPWGQPGDLIHWKQMSPFATQPAQVWFC